MKWAKAMDESDVTSLGSLGACPICSGELERGYAMVSRGLWWDIKKHTLRGGRILLSKYPTFTNTNFPALRCSKCHIIIFDYLMKE